MGVRTDRKKKQEDLLVLFKERLLTAAMPKMEGAVRAVSAKSLTDSMAEEADKISAEYPDRRGLLILANNHVTETLKQMFDTYKEGKV